MPKAFKRTVWPLAVLLVALLAGQAMAADKRILFVNSSDKEIKGIFLAPAGTPTVGPGWGKNLLTKWKLKPGRKIDIAVPHDKQNCMWDLKYVARQKMAYTIKNVDICNAVEIDLYVENEQAWATVK